MSFRRLHDRFIDTILPRWLDVSFDPDCLQFAEGLDLSGSPDPSEIVRTRTAARQIYVYSHASFLGVAPAGALDAAEAAAASLRRIAWMEGDTPGYVRSFNRRTGEIVDGERDLHDHACVLLALAWLSRASGKPDYHRSIDETFAAMDQTLAAPSGGWAEDGARSIPRRQNPHMHVFEAAIALWQCGCGDRYAARAGEMFALFQTRFYDTKLSALREFFGPNWETGSGFGSDRLEPGHMAEWVWLIRRYDELSRQNNSLYAEALLTSALRLGRDGTTPFLLDEVDTRGQALKPSRRLWPQAELLKATYMLSLDNALRWPRSHADDLSEAILAEYLEGDAAGFWRDCFDRDGSFVAKSVPGSSLYHLWSAVAEFATREMP